MKRSFQFIFLIAFFCRVDLFAQSSLETTTRIIKFIDLEEEVNQPFFGRYREITRLIMTAIESGSVKPYYLDYAHNAFVTDFTKDDYDQHMLFSYAVEPAPPSGICYERLFARDISYLGLDQTISVSKGKENTQVHYVNFYSHQVSSKKNITRLYRFSVTWADFITVLKQRSDLLYTPNTFGAWWRGNVFITNEEYFIGSTTPDFIELGRRNNVFAKDFSGAHTINTVDSLNEKIYDPTLMDIYVLEEKSSSSTWKINQIAFGTIPEQMSYLNEKRFLYTWQCFVNVNEESKTDTSKGIYTLADAFLLQKFHYSNEIKTIQISSNGFFENVTLIH